MQQKQNAIMFFWMIGSHYWEIRRSFASAIHKYSNINYTYNIRNVGHVSFGEEVDTYIDRIESIMRADGNAWNGMLIAEEFHLLIM